MPHNFFLSGLPKSGKTTVLREIIDELKKRKYKVAGFLSPEIKEHGTREGFYVEDVATGKRAVLASTIGDGPKVGKYHLNVKDFEEIALQSLSRLEKADVCIIDEIGRMELHSVAFADRLEQVIRGSAPIIASLNPDFSKEYEPFGKVYQVNEMNRNELEMQLLYDIFYLLDRKKSGKTAKKKKKAAVGKRNFTIEKKPKRIKLRKSKERNTRGKTRK